MSTPDLNAKNTQVEKLRRDLQTELVRLGHVIIWQDERVDDEGRLVAWAGFDVGSTAYVLELKPAATLFTPSVQGPNSIALITQRVTIRKTVGITEWTYRPWNGKPGAHGIADSLRDAILQARREYPGFKIFYRGHEMPEEPLS